MVNSTTTIDKSNIHLSPLTTEGIYLRIYVANSFSYQMIFMLFNSNVTGATSEAGFIPFLIHDLTRRVPPEEQECLPFRFTPDYSIFSFMCMFCRSLFDLLSFFVWPLCCLSFFELRILITPLVYSHSSQWSSWYPIVSFLLDIL